MAQQSKVKQINLERGFPTVEVACKKLVNELSTAKGQGYRAAVLIHGYGSSGVGGALRPAVRAKLKEPMMSGILRGSCPGESWINRKQEFIGACPQLRDMDSYIQGNPGLTVVLFR